jgi:hypothetical protein
VTKFEKFQHVPFIETFNCQIALLTKWAECLIVIKMELNKTVFHLNSYV